MNYVTNLKLWLSAWTKLCTYQDIHAVNPFSLSVVCKVHYGTTYTDSIMHERPLRESNTATMPSFIANQYLHFFMSVA